MGKTGTTNWMQVKGVKGQIRLVPQKDGEVKKPGPNQRFKPSATIRKFSRTSEQDQQGRGPRGGRGGRGGRGRRGEMKDQRLRRRIRRSKVSQMGAKQKAKK